MDKVEPVKYCIRPHLFFTSAYRIQWYFLNAETLDGWVAAFCLIGCLCDTCVIGIYSISSATVLLISFCVVMPKLVQVWSAERGVVNVLICKFELRCLSHTHPPPSLSSIHFCPSPPWPCINNSRLLLSWSISMETLTSCWDERSGPVIMAIRQDSRLGLSYL